MEPSAVTLVASIRELKYHGYDMWPADFDKLDEPNPDAVEAGLENLDKHVENLRKFGVPVVVAINRFPGDTDEEVETIIDHCENDLGIEAGVSDVFSEGGEGGTDIAEKLISSIEDNDEEFTHLYDDEDSVKEKIETVATEVYGADGVNYVGSAEEDIERIQGQGYDDMPVVMSKTFHSLSDDPAKKGAPTGWELDVRELYVSAGAGFIVVLTGDVLTLPGLPSRPAAADMDIDADGNISGLF
jgi:formate--tetrahydrofolate ligase